MKYLCKTYAVFRMFVQVYVIMPSMDKNEPIDTEQLPNTRVLKNGAVYDLDKKRIVSSVGVTTKITRENAREMQTKAVARKREVVRQAAAAGVQRADLIRAFGEDAWLAEVAQTQQVIATTPEAGKASTLAAGWLVRNAGMDEALDKEQGQQSAQSPVEAALAGLIDAITRTIPPPRDIIDADSD